MNFLKLNESKILLLLIALILLLSVLGQLIAFGGFVLAVQKHIAKIVFGLLVMYGTMRVNFRFWYSFAYVLYAVCLLLLLSVNILGMIRLGAQRWIDLYFLAFQPSEFMKLCLIFALARYYSDLTEYELMETRNHIVPLVLILIPTISILKQPDLGTAMLLVCVGVGTVFLAGFPTKACLISLFGFIGVCPFGWYFLRDYQKNRILNFINPERDPLGTGYHILQSKIAVGSGHICGKGLFCGTQSNLNFLPEKHTDFIFTTMAEEIGFIGSVLIICLFASLIYFIFWVGSNEKNRFAQYVCFGMALLLFSHVFINIGMVLGVVPVVGVPLPFLSYGGSATVTFMMCLGLTAGAMMQMYGAKLSIDR